MSFNRAKALKARPKIDQNNNSNVTKIKLVCKITKTKENKNLPISRDGLMQSKPKQTTVEKETTI